MIDIHTHLYFPDFETDRDEVVRRAREAGVHFMISVGTDPEDNQKAIGIAEAYDGIYAAVGLHPHFFNLSGIDGSRIAAEVGAMKSLAKHRRVVAIGECGLDYFSRDEPITDRQKAMQKEGFLAQVSIARELGLPLIIHTRPSAGTMDVYEDMFGILSDSKFEILNSKFILHCYQGDTEITKKFLGLPNVYFSFTGSITYPVKKMLVGMKDDPVEVLKMVPMERIFVETDCPYLTPQPMRGSRNEPAYVRYVADFVAAVKSVSLQDFETSMKSSLENIFPRDETACCF